ncbi:MAG TPA: hypothetical protein VGG84_15205 [Gemmatimonadaceae bacterium]|jgi:hypothetical protein
MQLRDVDLFRRYIENQNQAKLAEHAGCARQFVHKLATGQRTSCTETLARRLEESLRVLPGTLFVPRVSSTTDTSVA